MREKNYAEVMFTGLQAHRCNVADILFRHYPAELLKSLQQERDSVARLERDLALARSKENALAPVVTATDQINAQSKAEPMDSPLSTPSTPSPGSTSILSSPVPTWTANPPMEATAAQP